MSRLQRRRSQQTLYKPLQTGGSACGTVTVRRSEQEPPAEPTPPTDVPMLPGIGPLTLQNPRAVAAGAVVGALVITRL